MAHDIVKDSVEAQTGRAGLLIIGILVGGVLVINSYIASWTFDNPFYSNALALCRQETLAGRAMNVSLTRSPVGAGVDVDVKMRPADGNQDVRGYNRWRGVMDGEKKQAMISGRLNGPDIWESATWLLDKPKPAKDAATPEKPEDAAGEALPEESDELPQEARMSQHYGDYMQQEIDSFWLNVGQVLGGTNSVYGELNITFAGMPVETDESKEK